MKKKFSFILLLLTLMLSQQFNGYSQDTSKSLPDGTNGFYFTARTADTVFAIHKEDLAPNEFVGTSAMFRVGAGYIGDITAESLISPYDTEIFWCHVSFCSGNCCFQPVRSKEPARRG